MSALSCW
jgi:hypothetical protein